MNLPLQKPHYPRVLSIAGSDSGGCAGIQADLKTCSALGCYGMTAITAITAQNTLGVQAVQVLPPEMVRAQIHAVVSDIGVDAVKIGMLYSPEIVHVVAQVLREYVFANVVLDPVMVASSGDSLMQQQTVEVLVQELFPLVTLITPNLDEASCLLGRSIERVEQLEQAAHDLSELGARAVLLKGGHLSEQSAGAVVTDLLLDSSNHQTEQTQTYSSPRIASMNTRGTGCTLSSAIACYLALGLSLSEAVQQARAYILQAIEKGQSVQTGQGYGPLNHGFAPRGMRVLD
ncbi:MAG: bifunctional hydroxymethylpyrimidine kinase/phosphomethylpyrimidine kinase [Burkholderiaceae bacterium]